MSDLKKAAQQALEALRTLPAPAWTPHTAESIYSVITALEAALAAPQPEPVAKAWAEGYRQGVEDERTSEAMIGIAGFDAKLEPARQNPYGTAPPQRQPLSDEEIKEIANTPAAIPGSYVHAFARALEKAHEIGGDK